MSDSTVWWILAGLLVSAELLTGTFHLLMLAIGLAAGAVAAHANLSLTMQLVCAAAVGGGAVVLLQTLRPQPEKSQPAQSNADVNLDIGQTLHVTQWMADHTAQASYRGAVWTVELIGNPAQDPPIPGPYRIREIVGNRLRVVPA